LIETYNHMTTAVEERAEAERRFRCSQLRQQIG
jgi:hypothetical protein